MAGRIALTRDFWDQPVSFIAQEPYPRKPHKNMRLRDALVLAKKWGCRMWRANTNDVCVSHDLLSGDRRTLPVSLSRNDTSQALVSLLRKVIAATMQANQGKEKPVGTKVEEIVRNKFDTASDMVEEVREFVDAHASDNHKEPEASPGDNGAIKFYAPSKGGVSLLFSAAQYIHFRSHCQSGNFMPIWDCEHVCCKQACLGMSAVEEWRASSEEAVEAYSRTHDELKAAKAEIERLNAMIPKDNPEPSVVVTNRAVDVLATASDLTSVAGRRHYYLRAMAILERDCSPWPGGIAVKTRMFRALERLGEEQRWSEQLVKSMMDRDFSVFKMNLMAMKKSGGTRSMIGRGGWETFMSVLAAARAKQ